MLFQSCFASLSTFMLLYPVRRILKGLLRPPLGPSSSSSSVGFLTSRSHVVSHRLNEIVFSAYM